MGSKRSGIRIDYTLPDKDLLNHVLPSVVAKRYDHSEDAMRKRARKLGIKPITPRYDWDRHDALLRSSTTRSEVAMVIGCTTRAVARRRSAMGYREPTHENKTVNYLELLRAGFPSNARKNEGLSGIGSQMSDYSMELPPMERR